MFIYTPLSHVFSYTHTHVCIFCTPLCYYVSSEQQAEIGFCMHACTPPLLVSSYSWAMFSFDFPAKSSCVTSSFPMWVHGACYEDGEQDSPRGVQHATGGDVPGGEGKEGTDGRGSAGNTRDMAKGSSFLCRSACVIRARMRGSFLAILRNAEKFVFFPFLRGLLEKQWRSHELQSGGCQRALSSLVLSSDRK